MNIFNSPLVSVIIPTYNRKGLLMRAINSIINQDYKNIEIIVVDDGSTDETASLFNETIDNRIQYIQIKHSGACIARNKGIEICKGKYITFLDSDDTYRYNKISTQLKQITKTNCDVVSCCFNRHINKYIETIPQNIKSESVISCSDLLNGNLISTQTIFAKASILKEEMFNPGLPRFQDWDLAMRLSNKYKIIFYDDVLLDQYIQIDSISNNKQSYAEGMLKIILENYDTYIENKESLKSLLINIVEYNKQK